NVSLIAKGKTGFISREVWFHKWPTRRRDGRRTGRPKPMDPRTDASRHHLRAGERWPRRRKRRPLLGRAFLSRVRNSWPDYAQATRRAAAGNLRLQSVSGAVLHQR